LTAVKRSLQQGLPLEQLCLWRRTLQAHGFGHVGLEGLAGSGVGKRHGPGSLNGLASRSRCGFAKGAAGCCIPALERRVPSAPDPPGRTCSVTSGAAHTRGGHHGPCCGRSEGRHYLIAHPEL